MFTACVRSDAPSLSIIFFICAFTVASEMERCEAIILLDVPRATSRSTSISRIVLLDYWEWPPLASIPATILSASPSRRISTLIETLETQGGESGVGVRSNRAFPNQNVRGASAASRFLFENPLFDQILNVPQRRVVGSLRQFPPLFRCQFSLEAVE